MSKNVMNEHEECRIFAIVLKNKWLLFSKIANEIRTPSYNQIRKQKSEWLNRWVPDYIVIVPRKDGTKKLVFVEMKKQKWWYLNQYQKKRIENIKDCWIDVAVCKWAIEAINFINNIIDND